MKNPLAHLVTATRTWLELRRGPGRFRLGDAAMQFGRVILPARWLHWAAGRALARNAEIAREPDGAFRVRLAGPDRLIFFWPKEPDPNLWFLVDQEIEPRNPHCYTTPPIQLGPTSRVMDVGACEGLFAFRCLRQRLAAEVIAFEPSPVMARLLRRGAEANGVADRLRIEPCAVGAQAGTVPFDTSAGAQMGRLTESTPGTEPVACTTLDAYSAGHGLELRPVDLIKVDAEGADFDVLRGAEQCLRRGRPQIAVTTYHTEEHAAQIVDWLRQVQPRYRFRLKGFSFWTPRPRPVLLLASTLPDRG